MDRYQKVEKPRPESAINENEIRITGQGVIRNYVSYATSLLQEKHIKEIVLKAMGQAISKAVAIAEIIKKRMPGLYQMTTISSVSITDVWEPIEEGLVPLEMTRHVSMISISLSNRDFNKDSPGYQAPLHIEPPKHPPRYQQRQQPQQQQLFQLKQAQGQFNEVFERDSFGRGRARGRARGRGRGWGRGYGGYDTNQGGYGGYGNDQGGYGNDQGGYGNNQGGYGNNQGGYGNNQGGYGNNQGGYGNNQGGYGNNQGGYGGYGYNQGGGYGYEQENAWNSNWGRGGGRGRGGWNYRGGGYGGGRAGGGRTGGRGYANGRGRMGGRGRIGGRGRGNQY